MRGVPGAAMDMARGIEKQGLERDREIIPSIYQPTNEHPECPVPKWREADPNALRQSVVLLQSRGSELFMLGTIRTKEKCPVCGGGYKPVRNPMECNEIIGLQCPIDKTVPESYFIEARQFIDAKGDSPGRIFTDVNGRKFTDYRVALRQLEAMRQEMQDGKFDAARWSKKKLKAVTLAAKVPGFLNDLRLRFPFSKHPDDVESHFRLHIFPEAGNDDFRKFTYARILELYKKLKTKGREKTEINGRIVYGKPIEGLPPGEAAIGENVVRKCLRILKACLNYYLREGELTRDQVPPFPPCNPVARVNIWLATQEQQAIILAQVPDTHGDAKLALEVLCETGIRRNTVVCVVPTDLLFEGHVSICRAISPKGVIKKTKTGAEGKKPLSDSLYSRLVALANTRGHEEWLFQNSMGGMLNPEILSRIWTKAARKAEFHGLPLSVATRHSKSSQINAEADREKWEKIRKMGDWTNNATPKKHYVWGEEYLHGGPQAGPSLATVKK